jgi:hypothetical protein
VAFAAAVAVQVVDPHVEAFGFALVDAEVEAAELLGIGSLFFAFDLERDFEGLRRGQLLAAGFKLLPRRRFVTGVVPPPQPATSNTSARRASRGRERLTPVDYPPERLSVWVRRRS